MNNPSDVKPGARVVWHNPIGGTPLRGTIEGVTDDRGTARVKLDAPEDRIDLPTRTDRLQPDYNPQVVDALERALACARENPDPAAAEAYIQNALVAVKSAPAAVSES